MKITIHCTCPNLNADIQYTPAAGQEYAAHRLLDDIKSKILQHHMGPGHRITITHSIEDETRSPS